MTKNKMIKGFRTMDPEKQRAIASLGGKTAHAMGKAHKWTKEEARAAGIKSHATKRAHRFTSEEAKAAGKLSHSKREK